MDEEQIINGKTIEFGTFINTDIVVPLNTKEDIKDYIFFYINSAAESVKHFFIFSLRKSTWKINFPQKKLRNHHLP